MKIKIIALLCCAAFAATAQITNVNLGSAPNSGDGDTVRLAFARLNADVNWLAALAATNSADTNYAAQAAWFSFTNGAVDTVLADYLLTSSYNAGWGYFNTNVLSTLATNGSPVASTSITGLIPATQISGLTNSINAAGQYKDKVNEATTTALPAYGYTSANGGTITGTSIGGLTIDGITVAQGDSVLVKNETTAATNGVYLCTSVGSLIDYVLVRRNDFTNGEVTAGDQVFCLQGTVNTNTTWLLTTVDPITVGTTPMTFAQINSSLPATSITGTAYGNIVHTIAGTEHYANEGGYLPVTNYAYAGVSMKNVGYNLADGSLTNLIAGYFEIPFTGTTVGAGDSDDAIPSFQVMTNGVLAGQPVKSGDYGQNYPVNISDVGQVYFLPAGTKVQLAARFEDVSESMIITTVNFKLKLIY